MTAFIGFVVLLSIGMIAVLGGLALLTAASSFARVKGSEFVMFLAIEALGFGAIYLAIINAPFHMVMGAAS